MMSGTVIVEGDASQYAGATGPWRAAGDQGQRVFALRDLDEGDRHRGAWAISGTCPPSWRRPATLVVCGDAGEALGDSLYEARLFVRGEVKSLGADCVEKEMRPEHLDHLADLLERAECDAKAGGVPPLRLGPQALQFQHRQRLLRGDDER
jgi:hypothetical protein